MECNILQGCPVLHSHQSNTLPFTLSSQAKALKVDWKSPINAPVKPKLLGNKTLIEFPIKDVVDYIDWNPFSQVGVGVTDAGRCGRLHLQVCV